MLNWNTFLSALVGEVELHSQTKTYKQKLTENELWKIILFENIWMILLDDLCLLLWRQNFSKGVCGDKPLLIQLYLQLYSKSACELGRGTYAEETKLEYSSVLVPLTLLATLKHTSLWVNTCPIPKQSLRVIHFPPRQVLYRF